ncbi:MAG: SsrA-binding protein SmpB [Candidatus Pacebacteria bacterium]|nr:SsrA-binding protein SmpB [Candidatus Paceibacterota bacterium]MBP9842999.1 SsrA-binding protein SmpB [Candidatus Paceibacterota bacterium]
MTTYLSHKRAHFDYEILNTYEAGLVLLGHEVKSVRAKRGKLEGGFVVIRGGEAFLVGVNINPYQPSNMLKKHDPERARKLLLSKKELTEIERQTEAQGLTAIPLRLYNNGRNIKLELAIVKGKRKHDKRETIKERDTKRDIDRILKTQ